METIIEQYNKSIAFNWTIVLHAKICISTFYREYAD